MFIPLYDTGFSDRRIPWVTITLIVANILIFIVTAGSLYSSFGLFPARVLSNKNLYTLITNLFLHISFWHLFVNMWFLWIFADNIEHALGKFKFIIFYFFCGVLANLGYALITTAKMIPLVGASGAISGILGAYLVLYPGNRVETFFLLPPFIAKRIEISSFWFLIFWFILQLIFVYFLSNTLTAYSVHIIGFMSGLLFVKFFQPKRLATN